MAVYYPDEGNAIAFKKTESLRKFHNEKYMKGYLIVQKRETTAIIK